LFSILCAAAAPIAKPAGFYGPSHLFGLRGPVYETRLAVFAYDDAALKQLVDPLEEMANTIYPV